MLNRLADRFRNGPIDYRLLVPLLTGTLLVQVMTAVVRITTSYRAVELGLSIVWLGVIAAAFAIFPIFIAVQVGRFIDRGHDAHTNWLGSALVTIAGAGFVFWPSATGLLVTTAVMGVGHLMLMASQQMLCVRAAGPGSMERVFGNYMVAGAIGQGIGPYVVGWAGGEATVPPTQLLFGIGLATAVLILAVSLTIRPGRERRQAETGQDVVPVGTLLWMPGLLPVVVAGVIMISASDIILIYVPLLGAERSIDVRDIGLLLTVRAAASMVARLFYPRMVEASGHWPLMIASTLACAAAFAALAAPLSLPWMYVVMVVMGFSFGLATTLSITIIVDLTTAGARGTANSLRIMGNRIGQFVLPFGAGLVAAATGLAGLLLAMAAAIAAAAAAMHWRRPKPGPESPT
jgi:MFS family permease